VRSVLLSLNRTAALTALTASRLFSSLNSARDMGAVDIRFGYVRIPTSIVERADHSDLACRFGSAPLVASWFNAIMYMLMLVQASDLSM
jgi:hypothetical protein